ncbi:TIGR01458 family HAD-type hydrolase [Saccharophagus sp. K07]|jgi:phospholysine phosphohistidine inorganic pyrophosphate phosphatase|uniref:TIGR01458 family HAD-type hydrolase n=1 Tax=Saccharophagus sp. K07 TaxID=2283636 RepID=UPI001652A24E|nr:TIGR01458 family HAD-type hydrolase [Saccharophagus sp. K07]MBC6906647.1 TIGR01458 family HAD-type hydrolase [Saccharophagus sp. K07]
MHGVLIDLDGVIYQNDSLIAGADRSVRWLQHNSIPHLFVTNTTSKPRAALVEKLNSMGLGITPDSLLTPPSAAVAYLKQKGLKSIALFAPSATCSDFADVSESAAPEAVVIGDLAEEWSFDTLNRAFNLLINNPQAELIALGMSRYYRSGDMLKLDVGPFAAALAFATEKEPVVMGKPSPAFFQQAADLLGLKPVDLCMIGDDIKADVTGAQVCGIKGALVKTGKFRPEDLVRGRPDIVLDSFADLPDAWERFQASDS